MDNLEQMDRFLEKYNLLRLNHKEIETVNKPIRSNESETVIKNLLRNKCPRPNGLEPQVSSSKHLDNITGFFFPQNGRIE